MRSHRKSLDRLRREMAADQWKRFMRGAGAQSPHLFSHENPSRDRTAGIAIHSASEGDVETLLDESMQDDSQFEEMPLEFTTSSALTSAAGPLIA